MCVLINVRCRVSENWDCEKSHAFYSNFFFVITPTYFVLSYLTDKQLYVGNDSFYVGKSNKKSFISV